MTKPLPLRSRSFEASTNINPEVESALSAAASIALTLAEKSNPRVMIIANWKDGFILETDPRREDPLYYYLQKDDWSNAIGWSVSPDEWAGALDTASVEVFEHHKSQERELDTNNRREMYSRVISALANLMRKCTRITFRGELVTALRKDQQLSEALAAIGFEEFESSDDSLTWSRLTLPKPWWKFW